MIVPFAVEPAALLGEDPLHRAHQARLLEHWYELGVLTQTNFPQLVEAIGQLPQRSRKPWQAALTHFRCERHVEVAPSSEPDPAQSPDLPSLERGVLFVSAGQARALEVPANVPTRMAAGAHVEICRVDCADRSNLFRQARALGRAGIARDTATTEVWQTYFATLARLSKVVVAVDRYAASNLAQYRQASGAAHLLRELDRDGGRHWVTLYSAIAEPRGFKELVEAWENLAATLEEGGVREVVLHLAPDKVFQQNAHDRHLRFRDTVLQLGKGLEVLQKQRVDAHSDCQLLAITSAVREKEKVLRLASRSVRFGRQAGVPGLVRAVEEA